MENVCKTKNTTTSTWREEAFDHDERLIQWLKACYRQTAIPACSKQWADAKQRKRLLFDFARLADGASNEVDKSDLERCMEWYAARGPMLFRSTRDFKPLRDLHTIMLTSLLVADLICIREKLQNNNLSDSMIERTTLQSAKKGSDNEVLMDIENIIDGWDYRHSGKNPQKWVDTYRFKSINTINISGQVLNSRELMPSFYLHKTRGQIGLNTIKHLAQNTICEGATRLLTNWNLAVVKGAEPKLKDRIESDWAAIAFAFQALITGAEEIRRCLACNQLINDLNQQAKVCRRNSCRGEYYAREKR